MSLTGENTSFMMPVTPGYGMGGMGGGFGWGRDWIWLSVLFLFGYGNNGWGGFGGGGGMNGGVGSEVQRGFDHSATITKLDGLTTGLADLGFALNNTIVNGFNGVERSICNVGYQTQAGFNQLASQIASCCCDTQRAIDGVNYNLATQACDTRHAIQDGTRQIIDFLTTDKLSTLTAENSMLKTQNFIAANQEAQTAELLRRLAMPTPVPSYQVPNPYVGYGYNPCGCAA